LQYVGYHASPMRQQTDSLQMPQIKQSTQASYQRNAEVDEVREYLTFYWSTSAPPPCMSARKAITC